MIAQREPEHRVVIADDGVRLSLSVVGDGFPTLLIAGLGGKRNFWNDMLPHVSAGRRMILPDHRGCGESDRPNMGYTIARLTADMVQILDALALGCVDVVGHSTGGVIAQQLARWAPSRVRDLVLSGTWNRPDNHFRHTFATRLAVLQAAGPLIYSRLTAALGYPADWFDDPARVTAESLEFAARDLLPLEVSVARLRMLLDYEGLPDAELAGIRGSQFSSSAQSMTPLFLFVTSTGCTTHCQDPNCGSSQAAIFFPRSRAMLFGEALKAFFSGTEAAGRRRPMR